MNLLNFIIFLGILLIFSSVCIIGFYIITRGEKRMQPDGSYLVSGKILKGWSLYWERITEYKEVYFFGTILKEKCELVCKYDLSFSFAIIDIKEQFVVLGRQLSIEEKLKIENWLQCNLKVEENRLFFFVQEPVYYFPEWIRYPLSQCPPCMASVGGTLIYWPIVMMQSDLFLWTNYHNVAQVYFWILFCTSAACINKLIYNNV